MEMVSENVRDVFLSGRNSKNTDGYYLVDYRKLGEEKKW